MQNRIVVLGGTGKVGIELIEILGQRGYDHNLIMCYGSDKSDGKKVHFCGNTFLRAIGIGKLKIDEKDIVLSALNESVSKEILSKIDGKCQMIIDLSSAYRDEENIPLVIGKLNIDDVDLLKRKFVAGPNCVVAQIAPILKPISDAFGVKNVFISTYQAVSGKGYRAMDELFYQTKSIFEGGTEHATEEFEREISFNCIPVIGEFDDDGHTAEEVKIVNEINKITKKKIDPVVTCVRVPVFNCHGASVCFEVNKEEKIDPDQLAEFVTQMVPDVVFMGNHNYITQKQFSKCDGIAVSRFRQHNNRNIFSAWIVADNLRKGAASNAVDILDVVLQKLNGK